MQETPDKDPIWHLGKYIIKYDRKHNLALIATQTHLNNKDIDKALSNDFGNNPVITNKPKNMFSENPNRTVYGTC